MAGPSAHEELRPLEVRASSERAFGLFFGGLFAVLAAWYWWSGAPHALWWLLPAAAFAAAGLFAPRLLAPLNRLWTRLGLLLSRIMNPVVLGILFFLVVWPTAIAMRLFGKDPLRLKFEPAADSYWIPRDPPGPAGDSMKNQF